MINAAIVGLGRWGQNLVNAVQGKSEHLQFTHAVVRRPEAVRDFAAQHTLELSTDYERMLADADVQAVVLSTPHSQHVDQIIAAAAAGKPVFCEKPLTLTSADADRAIEACKRAGIALALGHNRRFWPSMRELKRLVAGGELGEILHIEGNFSNNNTSRQYTGWRGLRTESPAGGLTATGIHVLDAFVDLAGPVRRVHAQFLERDPTPEPVDTLTVVIEFANRISGVLCGIRSTPQFWRVHIFGKEGSAEALEDVEVVLRKNDSAPRRLTFEPVDSLRLELEAFAESVKTGAAYPISLEQMRDDVAAFEAIVKSIETGGPVLVR